MELQAGEADATLPFREALLLRNKEQGDLIRQQRQLEDDKRALRSELAAKRQCMQQLQARSAVPVCLHACAVPGTSCTPLEPLAATYMPAHLFQEPLRHWLVVQQSSICTRSLDICALYA